MNQNPEEILRRRELEVQGKIAVLDQKRKTSGLSLKESGQWDALKFRAISELVQFGIIR